MLGLHLVMLTLHTQFRITIEQDKKIDHTKYNILCSYCCMLTFKVFELFKLFAIQHPWATPPKFFSFIFYPSQEWSPTPPDLKKIPLAFLKAVCSHIPFWVDFTLKAQR